MTDTQYIMSDVILFVMVKYYLVISFPVIFFQRFSFTILLGISAHLFKRHGHRCGDRFSDKLFKKANRLVDKHRESTHAHQGPKYFPEYCLRLAQTADPMSRSVASEVVQQLKKGFAFFFLLRRRDSFALRFGLNDFHPAKRSGHISWLRIEQFSPI